MNDSPRSAQLLDLASHRSPPGADGMSRTLARAQRFTIERLAAERSGAPATFGAGSEIILLLPDAGARISGSHAAEVRGRCVAILPAGHYELALADRGEAYILATDRSDIGPDAAINADAYRAEDHRVRSIGAPFGAARGDPAIRIYPVEDIPIPPDNGRLRFLQSETMSINWVEYRGTRGRNALSPHSHRDFEQASLAIAGDFVHHLRTPWGPDAELWREDQHLTAGPGSIVIISPETIHTTEGIGEGLHILVDIFAPPRRDFIKKNWVFNAADYLEPQEAE